MTSLSSRQFTRRFLQNEKQEVLGDFAVCDCAEYADGWGRIGRRRKGRGHRSAESIVSAPEVRANTEADPDHRREKTERCAGRDRQGDRQ